MPQRFTGSVELCADDLDVSGLVAWISAISFRDWPQQSIRELKPAMVTDPSWFGFGDKFDPLVTKLIRNSLNAYNRMLSVVMPGHYIEPHKDEQAPYWLFRVHVPLLTNPQSKFIVNGVPHHMAVGSAYLVNTLAEHSVENDGDTPRVHFMFDVRKHA